MKNFPRPQGHKKKELKRPSRKGWSGRPSHHRPSREGQLRDEIVVAWGREIPGAARGPLAWSTLRRLVQDLTGLLSPDAQKALDLLAESQDFVGLLKARAVYGDPQQYRHHGRYLAAATVLNLLKKFPMEGSGLNPEREAENRFYQAELFCRLTNRRLRHFRNFDFTDARPLTKRLAVHEIFHSARRKIISWIGAQPPRDVFDLARFGPGGVVGLKRPFTTPYYKLRSQQTVSPGAYWHALKAVASCDSWVRALCQEVPGFNWDSDFGCVPYQTKLALIDQRVNITRSNEVTFVPKDAKTHRAIAIEPSLNVFLQLAVGRHFKNQLARAGCDLRDQTRNQRLARLGSQYDGDHSPATIDLSMASDTLSIELVRELLPVDWFELLDDLRSTQGVHRGTVITWEKFSSMGNGFTFELESMIFYALAQAVHDLLGETEHNRSVRQQFGLDVSDYQHLAVFGDDIIIPRRVAPMLIDVLRFCGFRVNADKSFIKGPFRESCGEDYFNGHSVRPFNLERSLSQHKDVVHLHNSLKHLAERSGLPMTATLHFLRCVMPRVVEIHLRGSEATRGDSYVWVTPDECHRSSLVTWDQALQAWNLPYVRSSAVVHRGRLGWRYLQFLYVGTLAESTDNLPDVLEARASGGRGGDVIRSGDTRAKIDFATGYFPSKEPRKVSGG